MPCDVKLSRQVSLCEAYWTALAILLVRSADDGQGCDVHRALPGLQLRDAGADLSQTNCNYIFHLQGEVLRNLENYGLNARLRTSLGRYVQSSAI